MPGSALLSSSLPQYVLRVDEIEPEMSIAENAEYVDALNDAVPHALGRKSGRSHMNPISRTVIAALVLGTRLGIAAAQTTAA